MKVAQWRRLAAPFLAARELVPDGYPLLKMAIPTQLACVVASWALGLLSRIERPPIQCDIGLGWGLLLALVLECAFLAIFILLRPYLGEIKLPGHIEKLREALRRSNGPDLAMTCLMVGFCEELFFRGTLPLWIGWMTAAAIFAAVHRPRALFHWVSLAGLGSIFYLEMRLTGGLLVPMIHHGVHDAVALGFLKALIQSGRDAELFGQ